MNRRMRMRLKEFGSIVEVQEYLEWMHRRSALLRDGERLTKTDGKRTDGAGEIRDITVPKQKTDVVPHREKATEALWQHFLI